MLLKAFDSPDFVSLYASRSHVNDDKLRARVSIIYLRGFKIYHIFNHATMVGAVGKNFKIMLSRLFQIANLES